MVNRRYTSGVSWFSAFFLLYRCAFIGLLAALIFRGQRIGWRAAWVWGALLALGIVVKAHHVDAPPLLVLLVLGLACGVMHFIPARAAVKR